MKKDDKSQFIELRKLELEEMLFMFDFLYKKRRRFCDFSSD